MLANNVDLDQMPLYVASDLGLHCLFMTLLRVFRKEWVKWALIHGPLKASTLLSYRKD